MRTTLALRMAPSVDPAATDPAPHEPAAWPLRGRVSAGADAEAVALAVADICRDTQRALQPVIGPRGVMALFNRSLHLCATAHPWLKAGEQDGNGTLDVAALQALLVQQRAPTALAGGTAVLLALHALLSTLIGGALTQRLLQPGWGPHDPDKASEQAPP